MPEPIKTNRLQIKPLETIRGKKIKDKEVFKFAKQKSNT